MNKAKWLAQWGYVEGTPEANAAWAAKLSFRPRRVSYYVRSDSIGPVKSQADGKVYDSLSGLYGSYEPGGNPQGIKYECVGNDTASLTNFTPPPRDDAKAHEAIQRTLQEAGI